MIVDFVQITIVIVTVEVLVSLSQASVADAIGGVDRESLSAGTNHVHLDSIFKPGAAALFVAAAGEVFAHVGHGVAPERGL